MKSNIYERLAKHLDDLPGGYPQAPDRVELKILEKLFSQEEAELALKLTLIPESALVVAKRAGLAPEEAESRLEDLCAKGLAFSIKRPGKKTLYMAAQFVIGIWEYHVNDLDEELVQLMRSYIPHLFTEEQWSRAPQLRTIPVGRSITPELEVMGYETAEELIKKQKKFLVAPCICRTEHALTGEACDKPLESCLVFGLGADYYERNGLGRVIDLEEALAILKKAEKAGLVLQPSNAQKIVNICCCCGCCCQVLKSIKRMPRPADVVSSPFTVKADPEACTGCGVCVDRCQMEALTVEDDLVVLDKGRCIGCGLCVTTCPGEALTLERKPDLEQKSVPTSMFRNYVAQGKVRGKMGPMAMAKMALKSKVDRLRAGEKS